MILVSNEVSSLIFADDQGRLNQRVAAVCDDVYLLTASLPLQLKRTPTEQAFGT